MARLVGKTVFITGAAGGIAAATAEELVSRGARVAMLDTDADALTAVASRLGAAAWQTPADVTIEDELGPAVEAASEWGDGLDAVVANAAINQVVRIQDLRPSEFDQVVAVNLSGAVHTALACLPHLRAARGYLLLVCSGAGLVQGPFQAAYNASKAGLHAFGNSIRPELAREGVGVGVVYFNAIATEAARSAINHPLMAPLGVDKVMTPRPVREAATAIAEAVERRSRSVFVPRAARLAAAQPAMFQALTDRWVTRRLRCTHRGS